MQRAPKRRREPTIALINVVFLMLVFFMVAGQIAPPIDDGLALVRTEGLDGRAPPDTLVIREDGTMVHRGETIDTAAAFAAALPEEERTRIRIVPDRALPAADLVRIAAELRGAGADRVLVVTERGLR